MAKKKETQDALDVLIEQCAVDLTAMLKSDQAALAKSVTEDAPADESAGSSGPASPPPPEESAAEGSPIDGGDASPPDDGSPPEAPPEASPADAAMAPEGSPEHESGEIEPAPTLEALTAEYLKHPPEVIKMHFLAAKAALVQAAGADMGGSPPPGAAPPGAPPMGPPPGSPPPGAAPMAMAELKGKKVETTDGNGGSVENGKMTKSEAKIAELEARLAKQDAEVQKQNKALAELVEVVATPIRKSIKGASDLKFINRAEDEKPLTKAESLSKTEIKDLLSVKIRSGKLSKNDLGLITQYSVGNVDVSKIKHLLAD